MTGSPLLLAGLSLALGALAAAAILLLSGSLDDDESVAAPTVTPTPDSTSEAAEEFVEQFQPLGCDLMDFATKLNAWTVEAQERGDRLEILGGIGFWREILAGIQGRVDDLPASEALLRTAAGDYIVALDTYLANLGEYWFTAQQPSGEAAVNQLAFADQQRLLLLAEAEQAAGGPISLSCPQPA